MWPVLSPEGEKPFPPLWLVSALPLFACTEAEQGVWEKGKHEFTGGKEGGGVEEVWDMEIKEIEW